MNYIQIVRRHYLPVLLMYAVIATSVFGIALLLFPENRTATFWISLATVEILLAMPFRGLVYATYPKNEREYGHRIAAVLPALLIAIDRYIAAMFVLLAVNAFVYDLGRYGLIIQIVFTTVFIVFALLLQVAAAGAEQGTESFSNPLDSPAVMASMLQSAEQRLSIRGKCSDAQQALKSLREDLSYKLPHVGKITSNDLYRQFADKVRVLTAKSNAPELNDEILRQLKTEADILRTEIPVIQSSLS